MIEFNTEQSFSFINCRNQFGQYFNSQIGVRGIGRVVSLNQNYWDDFGSFHSHSTQFSECDKYSILSSGKRIIL